VRAEALARRSGANSGVGYNYRFTPLVQYAKRLIDEGSLGEIVGYRGRFFTMFGADPMGHLSWRFRKEEGGYGVSTDILSHAVDLAHMLVGPIRRVVGASATFIKERPLPTAAGTHYARGSAEDPRGEVTNEDYAAMLAEFENGARGTFETSRTFLGPESQMAFDLYGTKGAVSWNFERMNELQLYLVTDSPHSGYTTVLSGDRFRHHGAFVPGNANSIGFEDVVTIEDYEFLQALARGVPHVPGFREAVDYVSVQETLIRSWKSQQWEDVLLLHSQ
jgi:predicted dehydrogenase